MPSALILSLRVQEPTVVHSNLSRAAHAAILKLIEQSDATLASTIHDGTQSKPITVSNVLELNTQAQTVSVSPDQQYAVRVTSLSQQVDDIAAHWDSATIEAIDLDGTMWMVEKVLRAPDDHPWAGAVSYEAIARAALEKAIKPSSRWTLEFASPVTFRQRGINQPLPLPELVFGSLLDRWNHFAPLTLPEELRQFVQEHIAVSRFDLRSVAVSTKNRALQIGSVGRCSYTAATSHDEYWLACVSILAGFAFYSGVGAGTARGFGRVRLLER